jgi:predicted ATPase/DNA-binding CsgD family transcriptional regulator
MRPPAETTPFIGRIDELRTVESLVADNPIVTLTGPGGCGKTRLALRVASRRPGDAFFVDLSNDREGDFVPATVVRQLGLAAHPMSAIHVLAAELSDREALVVLDNCEQVVDAVARLCQRLAEAAPALRILATSRERLGASGEVVYTVPGLSVPPGDAAPDGFELYDAVRLFVDRALRYRPDFASDDVEAISRICRDLDGLPLAIELAAACVRLMSPGRIARELSQRLMSYGARTAPSRHRSLRACVDWGHDLLSEEERAVFRRLAVFADPFDVAAAKAVAQVEDAERVLAQLVDKSLVVAEPARDRFRLLRTIREYARDRLDLAGEADDVRRRHRDAFVALAHSTDDEDEALSSVADDLLLAFESCDADDVCRLGPTLMSVMRRNHRTGTAAIGSRIAEAMPAASPQRRAELITSWATWPAGWHPPIRLQDATDAVALCRSSGAARSLALALVAAVKAGVGSLTHDELLALASEALDAARSASDPVVETAALDSLATVQELGDGAAAAAHLTEAVGTAYRASRAFGNAIRWHLIKLHDRQGHHRAALGEIEAMLRASDEGGTYRWRADAHRGPTLAQLGDEDGVHAAAARSMDVLMQRRTPAALRPDLLDALIAHNRGMALHLAGDLAGANAFYGEALAGLAPAPEADHAFRGLVLWRSWCLLGLGDGGTAVQAAKSLQDRPFGGPPEIDVWLLFAALDARGRGDYPAAESSAQELLPKAAAARRDDVVATLLEVLAGLTGAAPDAVRLLGAAAALRGTAGALLRLPPHLGFYEGDLARLRDELGPEKLEQHLTEGASLDLVEAVRCARRGRGARGRPSSGWASLTPAERAVIDLLGAGLSNQQIADRLYLSPRTVASHLRRVFAKLDVGSRTELVRMALTQS